ncbi:MAG: mannose-1-phosphate guanylyltransferase [Parcubacteria group bacterium Gr01-1014_33]|nr:MAG: mannose-1-phosphate guanylyltransferase [Parcubacteria group bacterium Gr01-1014_33]
MKSALILAGGFGTRIAPIANGKPKPLVEVAGMPIIAHQINFLYGHGIEKIRLSLHHRSQEIIDFCNQKWPGKIEYVVEPKPLGTGGGLKFAVGDWRDPFLVLNCDDILANGDMGEFLLQEPNTILCTYLEDARGYGLVHIEDGKIRKFVEKPTTKIGGYVNCGWYILDPHILKKVAKEAFMLEYDLFPFLAEEGNLSTFVHNGYWIGVGTKETYERANQDLKIALS